MLHTILVLISLMIRIRVDLRVLYVRFILILLCLQRINYLLLDIDFNKLYSSLVGLGRPLKLCYFFFCFFLQPTHCYHSFLFLPNIKISYRRITTPIRNKISWVFFFLFFHLHFSSLVSHYCV
jgi:hypothetical protein